ncbi:HAF repeat-containing protein [Nitrosospira multiformis]|uniref:HAF repeat-containing protein n=1 Tax=Nitrosospira multiformis TaxID=1231 RepID=UPI00089C458B|nr:HAF repeat-containing protein [Nitrosospira multiformis]SEA47416.1 probable extracellular repeat, HAF family [Nitrosospira multiformis]
MALNHCFKIHGLILITTLSAVTGFVSPAFGEETRSYLIDLNSREVTLLGTLGGGYSIGNGINDGGQVVGQSETAAGEGHAFITGSNGVGMTDIGTLGGKVSLASGINDAGQVVGYSETTNTGQLHAFITGPNGMGIVDLGGGTASAINDAGQVVGRSETDASGRTFRTFITGPNGVGMTNLGVSAPYAINNAGQVVGESYTAAGEFHAFITGPNGVGATDLGSLGGALTYSSAHDINDIGQVVGISNRSYCDEFIGVCSWHAFITGPNGVGMTDLGTLGGGYSSASGINDAGQVVGCPTQLQVSGMLLSPAPMAWA